MSSVKNRAYAALAQSLTAVRPDVNVDAKGFVTDVAQNLIAGLDPAAVELAKADLGAGGGQELGWKIRAAHSSAMLAVNTFAPWRADPATMPLAPSATALRFECKVTMGLGGQPPNLDVVIEGAAGVVAVESKCTEHLGLHEAKFVPNVVARMHSLAHASWLARFQDVHADTVHRHLDRAQLLKHYLGLKNCFPETPVTLLYLFWEPLNWAEFPECAEHRREITEFAHGLADPGLRFRAQSYAELWGGWDINHARLLARRYLVEI